MPGPSFYDPLSIQYSAAAFQAAAFSSVCSLGAYPIYNSLSPVHAEKILAPA